MVATGTARVHGSREGVQPSESKVLRNGSDVISIEDSERRNSEFDHIEIHSYTHADTDSSNSKRAGA